MSHHLPAGDLLEIVHSIKSLQQPELSESVDQGIIEIHLERDFSNLTAYFSKLLGITPDRFNVLNAASLLGLNERDNSTEVEALELLYAYHGNFPSHDTPSTKHPDLRKELDRPKVPEIVFSEIVSYCIN